MLSVDELKPGNVYLKSILLWLTFTCGVGYLQMTYVFVIDPLKPFYFMAPGVVGLIFGIMTGRIILLSNKLKLYSIRDPLTNAYNHGYYKRTINDWCNDKVIFSLILIDLDRFKHINDNHGHNVGDQVLVRISEIVHETKRMYDIFARHGGEEFAILVPRTELDTAAEFATRICNAISNSPMPADIQVTCSLGIAQFRPANDTFDSIFERADKALYESKRNGRNRVTLETFEDSEGKLGSEHISH